MLLTLSAAAALYAQTSLAVIPTNDSKIVHRWSLPGDPHGIALGPDGTVYVGLAKPQAVVAIDPIRGTIKKRVVLDSAEIAATKELVAMRTTPDGKRLVIANGSDESTTILSLPDLAVVREITIEGEPIRDALPDPKGRYLFLLGHHVHVYDANGNTELHTVGFDDPAAMAISDDGSRLAILGNNRIAFYDTTNFHEIRSGPIAEIKELTAALFAASDRVLVLLGRDALCEMPLTASQRPLREPICLPDGSGPQIAALASPQLLLFAERRCSSSAVFSSAGHAVAPASLYGVDAYAVAFDAQSDLLYTTERAGYLTIYKVPRPAIAH